jgi:hypothetical protein
MRESFYFGTGKNISVFLVLILFHVINRYATDGAVLGFGIFAGIFMRQGVIRPW